MGTLNKALIIGRLGQDPEIRYTQSNTAVANLSIATNERFKDSMGEWKERTEWHRVVAWGRKAEICQQYLKKGSQVYIEGPIQTRKWEDRDGQTRYTTEIKALGLQMLDSAGNADMEQGTPTGESTSAPAGNSNQNESVSGDVDLNDKFDDIDDDLPF